MARASRTYSERLFNAHSKLSTLPCFVPFLQGNLSERKAGRPVPSGSLEPIAARKQLEQPSGRPDDAIRERWPGRVSSI